MVRGRGARPGHRHVDESVFAWLVGPGFAKLYFMLEKELLEPKYDLHGFSVPDLVLGTPVESQPMLDAVNEAAQASLAASGAGKYGLSASVFSLQANSRQEAISRAGELQQRFFTNLATGLFIAFLLLPLSAISLSLYAIWREKVLAISLMSVVAGVFALVVLFLLWPLGENYSWVSTPLDRLQVFFELLNSAAGFILLGRSVPICLSD
jgi:hypothetical protein